MARVADPKRREEILRAARFVFNERGYNEARMAEIAARAKIAAGTLYLYFDSKEALVIALADDYMARLMEALAPALVHPDMAVAISESVRIALARSAEERDLLRLLCLNISLSSSAHKYSRAGHKNFQLALTNVFEARMAQGHIRRYDPAILAEMIKGLFEWVCEACLIWGDGNLTRYQETLTQMLQNALLPVEPQVKLKARSRSKAVNKKSRRK